MSTVEINKHSLSLPLFAKPRGLPANRSLIKQLKILKECIATGTNLDDALEAEGLTYNDLRYEFEEPMNYSPNQYKTLEDFSAYPHGIPVVSFFAGAGGADIGFEAAGFSQVASIEINRI